MELTFAEMYSGIGGFRYGLEKANQESGRFIREPSRTRKNLQYRRNIPNSENWREGRGATTNGFSRECVDSQSRVGNAEGQRESRIKRSDGRQFKEFRCVWANELDKYACQVYRKNFGGKELVEADIRTIDPNTIPDHTLLTAGFPCQSFSLAGKRRGFEDTRGTLFYEVARIASAKRPHLLLLENVKGILSNDEGKTFAKILQTLDELGYDVEWQVLNSKYFGVPQNRERVFIVGHLRTRSTKQIFPIGTSDSIPFEKGEGEPEGGETSFTLEATYSKNKSLHNMIEIPKTSWAIDSNYFKGTTVKDSIEKHRRQLIIHALYPRTGNPEQGGTGHLTRTSPESYALDAHNSMAIEEGMRIRRLTPVECERLQGFPDGWTEGVSDTQRYKLLGNAVTTTVIEFIGKHLSSLF